MSEATPPSLISFKPTPNEREASNYLFKKADTDNLGVLTGDKAVPFFSHSNLPPTILGEVWESTDPLNTGFLTPERFGVAFRLIGHSQATGGGEIKPEMIGTPGPFPTFEAYPIPTHLLPNSISSPPRPIAQQLQPQATGSFNASLNNSTSAVAGTAGVSISQEEKVRYSKLFLGSGPVGGLLDGDKARDIFIKSKLPYDKLGQIWNLADTHSRGSLDVADFTIGMHLIQHTMNNDLPSLPNVLSPALYASAIAMNSPPQQSLQTPSSPGMSNRSRVSVGSPLRAGSMSVNAPTRFISPQSTGLQQQQQSFVQNPYGSTFPAQQQQPIPAWDINAKEKSESDVYFDSVDVSRKGSIEGEAAVGFFSQSGLAIEILAKVWDLADIRDSGALNKDEFAVALRLIRDTVAGKELPTTLSLSMTPPSLRVQAPSAPQRDLLDLMDDEPTPLTSSIFPQTTGGSSVPVSRAIVPQSTGTSSYSQSALQGTIFPQATGASLNRSGTLTPQATGGFGGNFIPTATTAAIVPAVIQGSNFFEDNDIADSQSKLAVDTSTLSTLQVEHASTTSAVTTLSTKRAELEASLAATTSAINELQVSLSQARAAHETEREMVDSLSIRHKEQGDLLSRARHELITAESDLSALRVERTEIEGNYLRDKEDVRDMEKKMAEVGKETNELKEVLEKLKKEARQQKGLVAISKKQLSTAEGEKEKVANLITEEQARPLEVEEESSVQHLTAVEPSPFDHVDSPTSPSPFDHPHPLSNAATSASQFPLPLSPPVLSPSGSTRSTNPFERMNTSPSNLTQIMTSEPITHETESPVEESSSPKSPLAAVAAVGLGAVAVLGGVGASVVGVLGLGGSKENEEVEEKEQQLVVGQEPVGEKEEVVEATSPVNEVEEKKVELVEDKDPFALPEGSELAQPATNPTFDSNFDKGFGDDFTSSPVVAIHSHEEAPPTPTFDKEFEELDPPTTSTSATIEDVNPVTHSVPPTPVSKDEELPEEATEEDSSDDEEEIEDPTSTRRPSEGNSTSLDKSSEVALSDSGESFVHVPSITDKDESESKFPALESFESVPVVALPVVEENQSNLMAGARSISPVPHSEPIDHSTTTPFDDSPFDSPSTILDTTEVIPAAKKRAAPPPPPGRSSLSSSTSVFTSNANTAFDDAFATSSFPTTNKSATIDDFDDAFSDLPPPTSVMTTSSSSFGQQPPQSNDFDTFDDEFSFKPEFNKLDQSTSSSAFDDSFANFDSAFEPATNTTTKATSPSTNQESPTTTTTAIPNSGFSFDDAFGSEPFSSTNTSTTTSVPDYLDARTLPAPNLPARPSVSPALDNDVEGVKTIVDMGFSRTQALSALEKYDYDVSRALNSLLG